MKLSHKKIFIPITLAVFLSTILLAACSINDSDSPKKAVSRLPEFQQKAQKARAIINSVTPDKTLQCLGNLNLDAASKNKIQQEIDKFTMDNKMLSFVYVDINSGTGLAYNPEEKTTSQSTIKGPFLAAALDEDPSRFDLDKEDIKQVITVSDNECYEKLWEKYGTSCLVKWCDEVSVKESVGKKKYPRNITARDMANLWTKMYEFLNTHENLSEFISYFTGSKFSAIYEQLGKTYKVQSKAGWEDGLEYDENNNPISSIPDPRFVDGNPENDEVATNDAGIVYSDQNPYILVIFTNVSSDYEKLMPLVEAINQIHVDKNSD